MIKIAGLLIIKYKKNGADGIAQKTNSSSAAERSQSAKSPISRKDGDVHEKMREPIRHILMKDKNENADDCQIG